MSDKTPAHVRITFKLQPDEDGYPPSNYERLWAVPLSNGRYQIDNIPFFVALLADGDVVTATAAADGELFFEDIAERSGHSTVRIFVADEGDRENVRIALKELGCHSEGSHIKRLIAVDIPPNVDFGQLRKTLDTWSDEGRLEYEEACVY